MSRGVSEFIKKSMFQNYQNQQSEQQESKHDSDQIKENEGLPVQTLKQQIIEAPEQSPVVPRTVKELEIVSPRFRYYKLLYILSIIVVEFVILALTFFAFPWSAFGVRVDWTLVQIDYTWVYIFFIGNLISWLFFTIIKRSYYYIALGKKFW